MSQPSPARPKSLQRLAELVFLAGEYFTLHLVPRQGPGPIFGRLFKLPILTYRLGLGRLIGKRILLLTTIGRKTGKTRVTALSYGYEPATDTYFVTAGWQGPADWYLNLKAHPRVRVQVGARGFDCVAEELPEDAVMQQKAEYVRRNPFATRTFSRWLGLPFDGSETSLRAVAAHFPTIALRAKTR